MTHPQPTRGATMETTLLEYVIDYLKEELEAVYPDPTDRPNPNYKSHVRKLVNEAIEAKTGQDE